MIEIACSSARNDRRVLLFTTFQFLSCPGLFTEADNWSETAANSGRDNGIVRYELNSGEHEWAGSIALLYCKLQRSPSALLLCFLGAKTCWLANSSLLPLSADLSLNRSRPATGWKTERSQFESHTVCIPFRPALESTRSAPGALFPGIKRQGPEAAYSPPTSAEVNKTWIYTSTPPHVSMA
jgi:hypothetical protein